MLVVDVYRVGLLVSRHEGPNLTFDASGLELVDSARGPALVFDLRRGVVSAKRSPRAPLVNGVPGKGKLEPGDVVSWGDAVWVVNELPLPSEAEQAVLRSLQRDPVERAVYADWLESKGAVQFAEFTRLMGQSRTPRHAKRLQALASRVAATFRAMVTVAPIERCERGDCPRAWEALDFAPAMVRGCHVCSTQVQLFSVVAEARARAESAPVVLDPTLARSRNDLLPEVPEDYIIEGRPLVVDAAPRTAAALPSGATDEGLVAELLQAALDEHAAIAAFARTVCELLALGAPLVLVERTQQALGDEVRHAALTFAQVQRLGGVARHAGPLTQAVAPVARSVAAFRQDVHLGGLGEAKAAARAHARAQATADDALRGLYQVIAQDEARHAQLARDTVAWVDATFGPTDL